MTKRLLLTLLLVLPAFAQVPVVLAPVPRLQFFDSSGRTLSFGCVFTYQTGTSTPLATYTDFTGVTQNANPVVLNAGGFANIWLQAGQSYRFTIVAAGGVNCASGATQYSIDGLGGGTTLNTTVVTFSATPLFPIIAQNQLFEITLTGDASAQPLTATGIIPPSYVTFQITQDAAGGHAFSWPANSVGGCTIGSNPNQTTLQYFVWNGSQAIATGPCVVGNGPSIDTGNISVTGTATASVSFVSPAFISSSPNPASAGILRLANFNAINWRNFANSGDYGFSTSSNSSDIELLSSPGGLELTGASPFLRLGGSTASFPMWKQVGTGMQARLADDSNDAPISASAVTSIGPAIVNGVTLPTNAAAAANEILATTDTTHAAWATIPTLLGTTKDFSASGCTPSTSTDAACTGTITISPAFADASYIPQLTINSVNGAFLAVSVSGSLLAGSIPYTITCTFNCGTIVTPTIYVHAFHP